MRTILCSLATAGSAVALALTLALTAVPSAAVVVDGIAAVVNGEVITLLELEKAGRLALEDRLRTAPAADQERLRREVLTAVLDQLVLVRIQAQRARLAGVQVSPAEIDTAILNIREDNRMSEEVLARLLQEREMTREEYRRDIEDQIRLSKLVQREIRAKVTATDEEVAAWFNEHRLDWYRPEKIRIRHLLIPLPKGASADEVEAARARANALLDQVKGGMDFAALVRAETPGAAADADLVSGEMARGELFPALETAAFALPVGGVSEPVQSPAGFHLVQVVEKTPASEPQLEEVRASIEQKIAERKTRERYDTWLKQIRAEAIVEIRY
ncbi:MAG: peptidylprolyl isomerase [Candidatus Methylomirabilia bacterium]